nr:extracellular solute-binding protein [Limobrevibacterium gyesilva]
MRRRTFLGAAGLGAAALASRRAVAAERVVVGTWGGDYGDLLAKNVDEPIAGKLGLEVLHQTADASPRKAKLIAERAARRGTLDVALLSDVDMYEVSRHGLLDTLDMGRIANAPHIVASLARPYAIPQIYSGQVILYNPDKVNPAPRSYADLWDPKYRGRVGFSDLLYSQITSVAALVGGGSMSDYGPAKKALLDLKALGAKVYPSNETLAVALKGEEVWLTVMWLARGYQWRRSGINLRHAEPAEGVTPILYQGAIPKNAQNKAQAYAYLNAMLDPRAQAGFAARMGYVPTVTNATLPDDLAAQIALTPEQQARFRLPDYEYVAQHAAEIFDFWNRQFKA